MLSSSSKGQSAQLRVELEAIKKGYNVSRPTIDIGYDAIFDNGKKLIRAQIKHCNRKSSKQKGVLELNLISDNRKFYTDKEIDCLIVYCPQVDKLLFYDKSIFHKRKYLQINLVNPTSKFYYKKYIW